MSHVLVRQQVIKLLFHHKGLWLSGQLSVKNAQRNIICSPIFPYFEVSTIRRANCRTLRVLRSMFRPDVRDDKVFKFYGVIFEF